MSHSAKKMLMKSSAVIMLATLISRVFGLIRMQVINYYFSQELLDSFWAAYKIPNTLRELLAEGALSVAFIPIFASYLVKKGDDEANRLASNVFNILFIVVFVVVIAGIFLAPVFMPVYVSGFENDILNSADINIVKSAPYYLLRNVIMSNRTVLAIDLAMIMIPFLLFASMGSVVMGVLNGKKHFTAPAFAPIFFTTGVILSVLFLHKQLGVISLGWGVLIGGLLQFIFQLPFLKGKNIKYTLTLEPKYPGVREVLILMWPAALALGVVQLNQLLAPFFASFQSGGMAALQNSILLIQMPQGVFAIAVSTAILPTLAEQATRKDYKSLINSMENGLGLVLLFSIPAAMFFLFFGKEVVDAIFNLGGKFSLPAVQKTTKALFFYSFGLIGMGGSVLANRFFYSIKDMKTPLIIAIFAVLINLVSNIIFHFMNIGFEYIALANSIAVTFNFISLLILIQKRVGKFDWKSIFVESIKISISSVMMIIVIYFVNKFLAGIIKIGFLLTLVRLFIVVGVGGMIFVTFSKMMKVKEIEILFNSLKKRIKG